MTPGRFCSNLPNPKYLTDWICIARNSRTKTKSTEEETNALFLRVVNERLARVLHSNRGLNPQTDIKRGTNFSIVDSRNGFPAAPDVLGPDVLGPDVLGPYVLGPDVLGPDVLGPDSKIHFESRRCTSLIQKLCLTGLPRARVDLCDRGIGAWC